MKRKWVFGVVAAMLVLGVLKTLSDAGAFRSVHPHGSDACRPIEGAIGAEDADLDPMTGAVIISSQDRRAWLAGQPSPGGIFAWDPKANAAPQHLTMNFTGAFHPHGLSLFTAADGTRRLFVVNHPTELTSVVELFSLVGATPEALTLVHLRTVSAPEFISLNDLVAVGPESFYVTNDAGTVNHTAARVAETFLQLPWANVVFFDGKQASVAVKGLQLANGIATSRDGRTVFVSESIGRHLFAFARDAATGTLTELAREKLETGLDNISVDASGALWIGAHPKLLAFLSHAKDATAKSPSQVLRATWAPAEKRFEVHEVWLDDGTTLSGSSVGLPLGEGRFVVGSVFEDHLLDCKETP